MNKAMRARVLTSAAVLTVAFVATLGIARATDLTFVWHAGTCADALVAIAKDYPDKSVTIVPALVPYGPQWHDKIASEFAIQWRRIRFCHVGQPVYRRICAACGQAQ